jgi:hypothetical protein
MSETPKKKTPAKKAPAKKQGTKGTAPKKTTTGQRGRPRKVVATTDVSDKVEATLDNALARAEKVIDKVADEVIIRANDVKKISLRKRMLKWFK